MKRVAGQSASPGDGGPSFNSLLSLRGFKLISPRKMPQLPSYKLVWVGMVPFITLGTMQCKMHGSLGKKETVAQMVRVLSSEMGVLSFGPCFQHSLCMLSQAFIA